MYRTATIAWSIDHINVSNAQKDIITFKDSASSAHSPAKGATFQKKTITQIMLSHSIKWNGSL